jgi:FAD/FMN-containing dehydrogenase
VSWPRSGSKPEQAPRAPCRKRNRIAPRETAFGDRSAPYLLSIDSVWDDPGAAGENIDWTRSFWREMQPYSNGATYFNFPGLLEEGEPLVKTYFGASYDKLVQLKQVYDPSNLFFLNQNIRPVPHR